jgi:glycosyltransferase involved in cell wall biosynthesis
MMRWTFQKAHRVIAVSPALAERAISLGSSPERTHFLPNGVDTALFSVREKRDCRRHLGLDQDGAVAVCVGALCDRKDQGILVRSLAELRRRGSCPVRLILVGDGPNRRALQNEIASLGLHQHVQLVGARSYDEIPWWMGAADWLLLSSHYEGWPTVYFEAMACGRPVITSNVSAAKAAVCDPQYGIVVEPNTPQAFAHALEEAQSRTFDPSFIRAYAEQHSWDQWARSVLALIQVARAERKAHAQQ